MMKLIVLIIQFAFLVALTSSSYAGKSYKSLNYSPKFMPTPSGNNTPPPESNDEPEQNPPPPMTVDPIQEVETTVILPITIISNSNTPEDFPAGEDEFQYFQIVFPNEVNSSANLIENYTLEGSAKGEASLTTINGSGNGIYTINFEGDLYSGEFNLVIAQSNILNSSDNLTYTGSNVLSYTISPPSVEFEMEDDSVGSSFKEFMVELAYPSSEDITITLDLTNDVSIGEEIILVGDSNLISTPTTQLIDLYFESGEDEIEFFFYPNVDESENSIKFDLNFSTSTINEENDFSVDPIEYKVYFISENAILREDELENSISEGGALFLDLGVSSSNTESYTWSLTPNDKGHSFSYDPLIAPSPLLDTITTSTANIYFIPGPFAGETNVTITSANINEKNITLQVIAKVVGENEIEFTFPDEFQDSTDYRMVSFPFRFNDFKDFDQKIGKVFGSFGDQTYLVYRYNKVTNDYDLLNNLTYPIQGLGYWMAVAIGGEIELEENGPSDKELISVDLNSEGWHMIGNPFEGNILTNQMYVTHDNEFLAFDEQSILDPTIYVYDSTITSSNTYYVQSDLLEPFQAGWVYSTTTDNVTLTFAPGLNTISAEDSVSKPSFIKKKSVVVREPPSPPSSSVSSSSSGGGCLLGDSK